MNKSVLDIFIKIWNSHMEKKNLGPKSHAKIYVWSIIKLNVAAKTIRLLGEKKK